MRNTPVIRSWIFKLTFMKGKIILLIIVFFVLNIKSSAQPNASVYLNYKEFRGDLLRDCLLYSDSLKFIIYLDEKTINQG
jgi:hypothetical protein